MGFVKDCGCSISEGLTIGATALRVEERVHHCVAGEE